MTSFDLSNYRSSHDRSRGGSGSLSLRRLAGQWFRRGLLGMAAGAGAVTLLAAAACSSTTGAAPAPTAQPPAATNVTAPAAAATTASGSQPTTAPKASPSAGAAVATQAPAKLVDVKVGVVGSGGLSPLEAAVTLGNFEKAGLKVEVLGHKGGAEAAQALVGGGVQFFQGDFSHALRLNQQGQAIRVVAGVTERHSYTLVGNKNAKPGAATIEGQKLGITSPGSQTDNALRWLAKQNGLDPEKDFELPAIGSGAPMVAAIQQGQVYAGMLGEPFTAQLKSQGFPVVYDFAEEVVPFQGLVFMSKQSWVKENSETTKKFLKVYYDTTRQLLSDEKLRLELATKAYPDIDPRIAAVAAERLVKSYTADGKINEAGVKKVFEFEAAAQGTNKPVPALSEFSDFSYLP